jgi:hypothetical protein
VESQRTLIQPRIRVEEPLVLERYRLLEELGAGGFGTVWRARDELLQRDVAVKRIWLEGGGGQIDIERASREAHASARLSHPAIVALYEVCTVEHAFYLISELVDGDTLAQLIAAEELTDEEVVEIGLALAAALAHAHARGVVHRDIKPQNVLVPAHVDEHGGAAKLTDFGGASLAGEDVLTRTGDVLGTLAYMAPEQADGGDVDELADLYSFALVLYEALSGVNPVRGATPAATARRIGRPLESLARRRGDLPRPLTQAIDRALSPTPADRGTVERLRLVLAETHERGLEPSRWRRARRRHDTDAPGPVDETRRAPAVDAAVRPRVAHAPRPPRHSWELDAAEEPAEERAQPARWHIALPRAIWIVCAAAVVIWQAVAARPGVALLAFAALLPLLVLPSVPNRSRVGTAWVACALAPLLGVVSLAGAFPALAGQASRWRERLALGALGYWWLALAEPLLARRLWLGPAPGNPPRSVWESSISTSAAHVIDPLLSLGVLLGALLWGCGALVLPWIARGRNAALDTVAVVVWSAALLASAPALDSGLSAQAVHPSPHGAVLGAIAGALIALVARALRGPV